MNDDDYTYQMKDLFGPLAPHAEFSVGQLIHYRDEQGIVRTGEITWIEGPGKAIRGDHHPLQYWVNGLICLYQSDILGIDEETSEPTLVRCPYCDQLHSACTIEQCARKRNW
jgi:hypothetical protein